LNTPQSPNERNHKLRIGVGNGLRPDIWEAFQTRFRIPFIGEFYAATEGNAPLFNTVGLDGEGRGAVGRLGGILRFFLYYLFFFSFFLFCFFKKKTILIFRLVFPLKIIKFDVQNEVPIRGKDGHCIVVFIYLFIYLKLLYLFFFSSSFFQFFDSNSKIV